MLGDAAGIPRNDGDPAGSWFRCVFDVRVFDALRTLPLRGLRHCEAMGDERECVVPSRRNLQQPDLFVRGGQPVERPMLFPFFTKRT